MPLDDLTGTVLAGHHQPLQAWVLCLYFLGLNLSNRLIAQELDLNEDDAQVMTRRRTRPSSRAVTRGSERVFLKQKPDQHWTSARFPKGHRPTNQYSARFPKGH
jgi:hypothetical protein